MKKLYFWKILLGTLLLNVALAQNQNLDFNPLNDFGFKLYNEMRNPQKNLVISPYSLSSLLVILKAGAQGNTLNQFSKVLNIPQTSNYPLININSKQTLVANGLWSSQDLLYKPEFMHLLTKNYAVELHKINFQHNPEKARTSINNWVEKNTKNYIKNLIPSGIISIDTKLVLVNAIYFKGPWSSAFTKEQTQQKPFFLNPKKSIQVPMMRQNGLFSFAENQQLQMLILPYANSSIAMAVVLPKPGYNFINLNYNIFTKLLNSSNKQEVDVQLPKFNIESTFNNLDVTLKKMGLIDAFNDQANFANISKQKLFISAIIQKAIIQVDEEGTVAAAASGAVMNTTAMPVYKEFNANHPFMFVIYDQKSGLVLFMGEVNQLL